MVAEPTLPGFEATDERDRPRTVLVVEDQALVRKVVGRMLRRAGYAVIETTNGLEALDALRAAPDGFDLVLSDITMPRMDGELLAREVLAEFPTLPIVLMSGSFEPMPISRLPGITAWLRKPFTYRGLLKVIRGAEQRNRANAGLSRRPAATAER